MSDYDLINGEIINVTITVDEETVTGIINTAARGPAGADGSGTNSITSATTSDGTADLSLSNVTTATATVTGTLTADHIHGNLAGNVYGHIRAGETLEKGDPVYVSGSHGSGSTLIPIVSKADASNAAKMPAIGIMDAAVANNANGHMVIVGTITELDTTGLTVNAELYVDAGGGMSATPPTARAQPVARVERVNANNGAVIVKVNGLSASDATANTLVRRDSSGGASFAGTVNLNIGVISDLRFEDYQAAADATFTYGTGAASAHRIALGAGTTGAALFGAATQKSANETIGRITKIRTTNSTGKTNNTFAADTELTGWSLKANTVYKAEVRLRYTTGGGFGIKFQFATPSLRYASGDWGSGVIAIPGSSATFQGVYNSGANVVFVNSTFNVTGGYATGFFEFETGATAGAAELQWAQASTGATATTLLAGSTITITERTP